MTAYDYIHVLALISLPLLFGIVALVMLRHHDRKDNTR